MLNTEKIPFNKILENTVLISNLWFYELITLWAIIVILFLIIFYFWPLILIKLKVMKLDKWAKERKRLLNKIITQKQIETEIEEEVKKLELKN